MSHDAWAAFSSIELARDCLAVPSNWFQSPPAWLYQTYATRDPGSGWPHPDGVVEVEPVSAGENLLVAVEFKRPNEGVHGLLTGIGQVQAYVAKGFAASVLVVPREYENLSAAGEYVAAVLWRSSPIAPVGVFSYSEPDLSAVSPFEGRLTCWRSVQLDATSTPAPQPSTAAGRQRTQWAHVREGSTTPDALYRYLQIVRDSTANWVAEVSPDLRAAVRRIDVESEPNFFLSYTSQAGGKRPIADAAWRRFWFTCVLTSDVQRIWTNSAPPLIRDASPTAIAQWDGSRVVFFARADGIKSKIVREINTGSLSLTAAWDLFAKNIRARAHQFREDLDSGAEALGFIDSDGRLTELGFRFVLACERSGNAMDPQPVSILRRALLTNGGYLALLHYIHAIGDQAFRRDELAFAQLDKAQSGTARVRFKSVEYRQHLLNELSNTLRVAGRAAPRGGRKRPPLEAEFITLRKLGLVGSFRAGLGLEINWPAVHDVVASGTT